MNVADSGGSPRLGLGGRAEGAQPAPPVGPQAAQAGEASIPLGSLGGPVAGGPFRREGLVNRILPFALVAALAELSLALPPGPTSMLTTALSAALLAIASAAVVFVPWDWLPRPLAVCVPLVYTASVLPLILASGGQSSGVSVVLFIPITWTALYHQPWESGCVVGAVLLVLFTASFIPKEAALSDIIRRVVFWGALAAGISVAAHGLRARIRRSQEATARLQGRLREMSILQDRDRIASNLQDTVVQRLFAAGLTLQGIGLLTGLPEAGQRIDAVVRNLDEAIRLLRQSIFGLEHGLPEQGLRRSILDVTSELTPMLGVVPEVTLDGPIDTAVPPEVAGPLLGALREALSQSGTTARATRVAVSVAAGETEVSLSVTDNGSRWPTRAPADGPRLSNLRDRAHRLGGSFEVAPAPEGGTRVMWRVPLPAPGEPPEASLQLLPGGFPVPAPEPDRDQPQRGKDRA